MSEDPRVEFLRDLGYEHVSPAMLPDVAQRLSALFNKALLSKAFDALAPDDAKAFEDVIGDESHENEAAAYGAIVKFLQEHLDLPKLIADTKKELRDKLHPLKTATAEGDRAEELLSAIAEPVTDTIDNSLLSAAATALDLAYDPARGVRTVEERQGRLARKLAVAAASGLTTAWLSIAIIITCRILSVRWPVLAVPKALNEKLPKWLISVSAERQFLYLAILGCGAVALSLIAMWLIPKVVYGQWVTNILKRPVSQDDCASTVVRAAFESRGVTMDDSNIAKSAELVYMCILTSRIGSPDEYDREKRIVQQLYVTRGEEQVVRYVRARVRGYRRRLSDEAQKLANETAEVLALVG